MSSKRLVIDTNVYLSALLFGGNPRRVVEHALFDGYTVVVSEEIYTEMLKVITSKFQKFETEYRVFEALLREYAVPVQLGKVTVDVSRDAKDNMIIETAVIGEVDFIVTGDNDLLVLKSYNRIKIMTPADFVDGEVSK